MSTLEKAIEKRLSDKVRSRGWLSYKFSSPARRGVPDRLLVLPGGAVVFVEVKRAGGKLSRLQEVEIETLQGVGAEVFVVWSHEDVDGLLSILDARVHRT